MWSSPIWKNSLQCFERKRADLFLHRPPLPRQPPPEKNERVHTRNPHYPKEKGHWSPGPARGAELPVLDESVPSSGAQGARHGTCRNVNPALHLPFLDSTPQSGSPARAVCTQMLPDAQPSWSRPALHARTTTGHVG